MSAKKPTPSQVQALEDVEKYLPVLLLDEADKDDVITKLRKSMREKKRALRALW